MTANFRLAGEYNALMRIVTILSLFVILVLSPGKLLAQWATATSPDNELSPENIIAFSDNTDGYRLEIYKDMAGAIKSRFILKNGLISLSDNICPTFQIDNGMVRNDSIDNTPCIYTKNWSEYVIGKIVNNRIDSAVLVALMDGITLTFRFRLQNGDYRETKFSLVGSKRSLTIILGAQVTVNEL